MKVAEPMFSPELDESSGQAIGPVPDPGRSSMAGHGALGIEIVHGQSGLVGAWASSPLKLLAPRVRGRSVWVYTSNFGGGYVAGDVTRLEINVGPGARAFVGTQSSTKIYENREQLPCGSMTTARVGKGGLLVFAPDPVQAAATRLLERIAAQPVERRAALVTSASPLRDGALLRVAGEDVARVGAEVHSHLGDLEQWLGDDPWEVRR